MAETKDEPKLTLPTGHPQGTYVGPDPSFRDSVGILPDEYEKEYQDAVKAHEEEKKAAAEHEHKIASEAVKEAEKEEKAAEKEAAKSSGSKASS